MQRIRRLILRKKLVVAVLILTLALIWGQSVLNRSRSAQESNWVFEKLESVLRFFVGDELATEVKLRKIAHFGEFFLLGSEAMLLAFLLGKSDARSLVAVFLLVNFCALLDETIQIFSKRGSMVSDVWIDTAGAVTGILFMLYLRAVWSTLKENMAERRRIREGDRR